MGKNRRKGRISAADRSKLNRLENPFQGVPLSALDRYDRELTQELTALSAERERLKLIQHMIAEEIKDRAVTDEAGHVLRITDHAVVRYLERHRGLNLQEVEDDILDMVEDGRSEVAVRDGIVATVLPIGQSSLEHVVLKGKVRCISHDTD